MSTKRLLAITLMVLASAAVAEDKPSKTLEEKDAKVVKKLLEEISLCEHELAEEVLEEALAAVFKETGVDPMENRLALMVLNYCEMATEELDDSVFDVSNKYPNKPQALDARVVQKIIEPTFKCGDGNASKKILEKLVAKVIGVAPGEKRISSMVKNYCDASKKEQTTKKTEL